MMNITQTLDFERSTKNTHVFKAPKGSAIDTLYITKDAVAGLNAGPNVTRIQIVVEVMDTGTA